MKVISKKIMLSLAVLTILTVTFVFPNASIKAADEAFYIYVWVMDEKGNSLTNWNYEPGFIGDSGPSHEHLNKFGSTLISINKTANDKYRYFKFGINDDYEDYSEVFEITEPFSMLQVQLAKKGSGTTKSTLIHPDDPAYPADPLNPTGAPENKVDIHGFVKDAGGGISNAAVTIKNPTKPEVVYSKTVTTDSNGYYYLSGVDEKRFGTFQITAVKDGSVILTATSKKEYYMGSGFGLLDSNTSYDFGSAAVTETYAITITGGTAAPAAAPAGSRVNITADIPAQKQFLNWSSSAADIVFENAGSPTTSFTMPNHAVSVQANYADIPSGNVDPPTDKPDPPLPESTEQPPKPDDVQAFNISLDRETLTLGKGNRVELTAQVTPEEAADDPVTWKSSDTSVAVVENGMVKGINQGKAVITASTANLKTAECIVTVAVVKLNAAAAPLQKGKSSKGLIIESKYPFNDKAAKWTTSNKKIVQVDAKSGKIKGIAKGTAKITVTMKSGASATCKVKVQSKKVVTRKVTLDKKKLTLQPGKKVLLTAKKDPVTAAETLKWSTSNKKVASVDVHGKVTAKKPGTAVITVKTSNGKKAVCKITVP